MSKTITNVCLTCGQPYTDHTRPHTLAEIIAQLRFRISESTDVRTSSFPIDGIDLLTLMETPEKLLDPDELEEHADAYAERVDNYREWYERYREHEASK